MGRVLRGGADATEAVHRAIQAREGSVGALARRHGIGPAATQERRERQTVADGRTGPKRVRSTALSIEEEAATVAFRRHTPPPLGDRLCALQPTVPHLARSSPRRRPRRHGIARLPDADGGKPKRSRFKAWPDRPLPPRHRRGAH